MNEIKQWNVQNKKKTDAKRSKVCKITEQNNNQLMANKSVQNNNDWKDHECKHREYR